MREKNSLQIETDQKSQVKYLVFFFSSVDIKWISNDAMNASISCKPSHTRHNSYTIS